MNLYASARTPLALVRGRSSICITPAPLPVKTDAHGNIKSTTTQKGTKEHSYETKERNGPGPHVEQPGLWGGHGDCEEGYRPPITASPCTCFATSARPVSGEMLSAGDLRRASMLVVKPIDAIITLRGGAAASVVRYTYAGERSKE